MMLIAAALLALGVLVFTLAVRPQDLPAPEPVSPVKHLEERKATIYENLRDLQFEYRVGKLSEHDYTRTKQDLQRELAAVLAEIDRVESPGATPAPPVTAPAEKRAGEGAVACPHCGARFPSAMKFCGECGRPIPVEAAK
jgi:hypothetical protein